MDVNQVYQLVQFISNKSQNGYVTPSQFNLIINQAQNSYTSFLLGSFQQYTPGRPIARVELGNNSVVRQRLTPIIKAATLTIDGTGFSPYPSDYVQVDAIRTDSLQRVRFVQQDSLYSYYNSVIDPVATNPIYLLEDTGLRFYPATLGSARLSYVSDPVDIVWAYKLDANSRPVYTTGIQGVNVLNGGSGYASATVTFSAPPAGGVTATGTVTLTGGVVTGIVMTNNGSGYNNTTPTVTFNGVGGTSAALGSPIVSVDPVWHVTSILEIVTRALSMVGVNLQAGAISQYAQEIKANGQ
jgi:hypothetical protein